jgi:hypothetical protein
MYRGGRSFAGAVRADRPAVQLHQLTNDREAETEAARDSRLLCRLRRLPESVEDERQVLRLDANPRP